MYHAGASKVDQDQSDLKFTQMTILMHKAAIRSTHAWG